MEKRGLVERRRSFHILLAVSVFIIAVAAIIYFNRFGVVKTVNAADTYGWTAHGPCENAKVNGKEEGKVVYTEYRSTPQGGVEKIGEWVVVVAPCKNQPPNIPNIPVPPPNIIPNIPVPPPNIIPPPCIPGKFICTGSDCDVNRNFKLICWNGCYGGEIVVGCPFNVIGPPVVTVGDKGPCLPGKTSTQLVLGGDSSFGGEELSLVASWNVNDEDVSSPIKMTIGCSLENNGIVQVNGCGLPIVSLYDKITHNFVGYLPIKNIFEGGLSIIFTYNNPCNLVQASPPQGANGQWFSWIIIIIIISVTIVYLLYKGMMPEKEDLSVVAKALMGGVGVGGVALSGASLRRWEKFNELGREAKGYLNSEAVSGGSMTSNSGGSVSAGASGGAGEASLGSGGSGAIVGLGAVGGGVAVKTVDSLRNVGGGGRSGSQSIFSKLKSAFGRAVSGGTGNTGSGIAGIGSAGGGAGGSSGGMAVDTGAVGGGVVAAFKRRRGEEVSSNDVNRWNLFNKLKGAGVASLGSGGRVGKEAIAKADAIYRRMKILHKFLDKRYYLGALVILAEVKRELDRKKKE